MSAQFVSCRIKS